MHRSTLLWVASALLVPGCQGDVQLFPQPEGARKEIGPEGGSLRSKDDRFELHIPPGALSEPTKIAIFLDPEAPASLGPAYHIEPNIDLEVPAELTYDWSGVDTRDFDPNTFVLGRGRTTRWDALPCDAPNLELEQVRCEDDALSYRYGMFVVLGGGGGSTSEGPGSSGSDTGGTGGDATGSTGLTGTSGGDEDTDTGGATCDGDAKAFGNRCIVAGASVDAGEQPEAVALGDLDDDGNLDLAVAERSVGMIHLRLGDGTGNFGLETVYPIGESPSALVLGDFDGDGNLDLAATNAADDDDASVSVLLSDGSGSFGLEQVFAVGDLPIDLAAADFDEDGNLDLATANAGDATVTVLRGDGSGAFTRSDIDLGAEPLALAIGDMTGNGNLDLVAATGASVTLLGGNGAGQFGSPSTTALDADALDLVLGTFNADAHVDAATSNIGGNVTLALGTGIGSFGSNTPYPAGPTPGALISADFDGDGALDLATANADDGTVALLRGDGKGAFESPVTLDAGTDPRALATGDLDGDGTTDFVVVNGDGQLRAFFVLD